MNHVYKITNPHNGREYIGVSKDPERRFKDHRRNKSPIGNAIRKYNLTFEDVEIIASGTDEEMYQLERELVTTEYIQDSKSYNLTEGGIGRKGYTHSEEAKAKMSQAKLGTVPWNKGKKTSDETRAKQSAAKLGKKGLPLSQEAKDKISKANSGENHGMYGKTHSEEARKRISEASKKTALQYRDKLVEQFKNNNPNATKVICPHCGKEGSLGGMKRWHFDNCKNKGS